MKASSHTSPAPASEHSTGTGVLALAPTPQAEIKTRKLLPRTKLGDSHGIVKADAGAGTDGPRQSIVTRRRKWLRRRRLKRVLTAIAVILCIFPPMWAVYLIGWLIWRSRPPQQSMRRVRKAVRALERNRTGVALKQLQEAHYLDPSNNDALYWLGLLLSRQHRQEEAEEALSLVAERVPGLPEVEAALAEAYMAMDEPENAVYHAQRLFDLAPNAPHALLTLAKAFEAADRLDLAIQTLEQAPLHKRALTDELVQIHYRLGTLYEQQSDPDRALHHFKRVYARDISYQDVRFRVKALEDRQGE